MSVRFKVYVPGSVIDEVDHFYDSLAEVSKDDRVCWLDERYGVWYEGVVVDVAAKTVLVSAPYMYAYEKSRDYSLDVKRVGLDKVRRRMVPSQALQEGVRLEIGGFVIDGWKHPVGNGYQALPKGVFYGRIDGDTCTPPVGSVGTAIAGALKLLVSGFYARDLAGRIDAHQRAIDGLGLSQRSELADQVQALHAAQRRLLGVYKSQAMAPDVVNAAWPGERQLSESLSLVDQRDAAAQACLLRLTQSLPADTKLHEGGSWIRLKDRWESEHYYATADGQGGGAGWATCAVEFLPGSSEVVSSSLNDELGCSLSDDSLDVECGVLRCQA